jgi:Lrp/AsnC family leucine-responsive transcriptional regulator
MLDQTDWQIIRCLQKDARMQWQEIGKQVHLSGQAVAARIRRLQEDGIIENFTIQLNGEKLGKSILALITVFMKSANHVAFQQYIRQQTSIEEVHRISGEGCYWVRARVATQSELNALLDGILVHGNYKLHLSIGKIK